MKLLFSVSLLCAGVFGLISEIRLSQENQQFSLNFPHKLDNHKVGPKSALTLRFQPEGATDMAQKNLVLDCGKTANYYEFACSPSSGLCEAKIPNGKVYSDDHAKECQAVLLLVSKNTEVKPVKWDLGNVVFGKKLPSSPTFKKSPDQKEDLFGLLPEIKPSFEDEKIPTVQVVHYLFLALITACWLIFPLLGAKDGGIGKLRAVLKAFTYSMRSFAFMLSISAFFGFALMSWGRLDIFQTVAYGPIVVMLLGITGFLALKELYACNGMGKPAKSE